ncbi:hypothetical protein VP01_2753g4 [Puccinia sorghi]|uniref:Uncharacterized protein n=1 Tax=Puccinia sorghi TaxID=27349 RepID=A0A0L6V4T4_9BASI|nr:hypothetical protein VP01_2753g4 [Puccinia sorghi]
MLKSNFTYVKLAEVSLSSYLASRQSTHQGGRWQHAPPVGHQLSPVLVPQKSKRSFTTRTAKKFPSKSLTPSAWTSSLKPRRTTKIASVLNKEGQLNLEEHARREKAGLCLYCGGKNELDSSVKRITCEAAKLGKK